MISEEAIDYLLKIVMVGDSGVGKTNLLSRFIKNEFNSDLKNTIGVDFSAMDMKINNKSVKIQFWDTAGQEKYKAIASAYYKNAHGAFLVYDITRKQTYQKINIWIEELQRHGDNKIKIMLIGNKNDIEEDREVSIEDAKEFCKNKEIFFMETSAKTNKDQCVNKSFNVLIEEILKNQEKEDMSYAKKELMSLDSHSVNNKNKEKDGCC